METNSPTESTTIKFALRQEALLVLLDQIKRNYTVIRSLLQAPSKETPTDLEIQVV